MCIAKNLNWIILLQYSCMARLQDINVLWQTVNISFFLISHTQTHTNNTHRLPSQHQICVSRVSVWTGCSHVKQKRLSFCEAPAEDLLHTSTMALAKMESGYSFPLGVSVWELKRWNMVRQCPLASACGRPWRLGTRPWPATAEF